MANDSPFNQMKGDSSTKVTNKKVRDNWDDIFPYPFTLCRDCETNEQNGGDGKCDNGVCGLLG